MATISAGAAPLVKYRPAGLAKLRVKLTLFAFMAIFLVEIAIGWSPRNVLALTDPWVSGGYVAVLCGLLVRSWAAGTIVKQFRLATTGPYRWCRHPLYFGSFLMMCGFAVLSGHWLNVAAALAAAAITFGLAISAEEEFLISKFGRRYRIFAASTSAFIPWFPRRLRLASWNLARWLDNREFNAWLGAAIGVGGLIAWYAWANRG